MRRIQTAAMLAVAVGSLSGLGTGVGVADAGTPQQNQTVAQPPAAPNQLALQQIAPVQHAPQYTAALQQAAPTQATGAVETAAQEAVQNAPRQATVQGYGDAAPTARTDQHQAAILPAVARPVDEHTPRTVVQGAMQTSPEAALRTTPRDAVTTTRQAAERTVAAPRDTATAAQTVLTQQAAPQADTRGAGQGGSDTVSQNVLQSAPHTVNNVFSLTQ